MSEEYARQRVRELQAEVDGLVLVNRQLKADYDRVERERLEEASAKFRMGEAVQEYERRVSRLEDEVADLEKELDDLQRELENEIAARDALADDEAAAREEADHLRDELARTHKMFSDGGSTETHEHER